MRNLSLAIKTLSSLSREDRGTFVLELELDDELDDDDDDDDEDDADGYANAPRYAKA